MDTVKRPPCFECDKLSTVDHHVVPKSRGGERTIPLCDVCHELVHGISVGSLISDAAIRKRIREAGRRTRYGMTTNRKTGELCEDKHEQSVIAKIVEWRNLDWTYQAICRELTRRSLFTRIGGEFAEATVRNIYLRERKNAKKRLAEQAAKACREKAIASLERSGDGL